jgi:hypothetical protein
MNLILGILLMLVCIRPLKQIIECLNRTLKYYYKHTNGFNSLDGTVSYVNLFTAYFNFLRPSFSS